MLFRSHARAVRRGDDQRRPALHGDEGPAVVADLTSRGFSPDALAGADSLELDLAAVGEIDSAGLQLLLMLKKEALRLGKRVAIVAHSQPVHAVIDFCNVAAELGDPLLIPAREAA